MNLKKSHIAFTLAVAALALGHADADAQATTVKAMTDSTQLVQGSRTSLRVEVLQNGLGGTLVDAPEDGTEFEGIEFQALRIDTADLGNNRYQLTYNYTLQAFDPGTVTLPPFRFANGADTAQSASLTIKVHEVDLDSLTDIHPMESTVEVPTKWYDIFPDWWIWVVVAIAAGALIVIGFLLLKRKKTFISKPKEVTPPYDLAIQRLQQLQTRNLPGTGREKEYYTELTDILRQYLDGRFGINAMEMSSTQIIDTLRHNKETLPGSDLMKQILEIADFVKFAKVRPLPDDNVRSFNSAMKFVEDSKPLPPAPADESDATTAADSKQTPNHV